MTCKQIKNYKPILAKCYATDRALIEKWHQVAGTGLQSCIDREFQDLRQANVIFYQVIEGKSLIGYFCKETFVGKQFLTGFFIIPEYRTKKIKEEFWALANSEFSRPFFCGLFEKNIPANKFIRSKGALPILKSILPDGMSVLYKVG